MFLERTQLRNFLLEKSLLNPFEGEVEYKFLGKFLDTAFNFIFGYCLMLIEFRRKSMEYEGKVNENAIQELKVFLYTNLVRMQSESSFNTILVGLKRILAKYKEREEEVSEGIGAPLKAGWKFLTQTIPRHLQGVSMILGMISTISFLVVPFIKAKKEEANRFKTDEHSKKVYLNYVSPEVIKLINESASGNILNVSRLKSRMYEMIDRICDKEPRLFPYLSSWDVPFA